MKLAAYAQCANSKYADPKKDLRRNAILGFCSIKQIQRKSCLARGDQFIATTQDGFCDRRRSSKASPLIEKRLERLKPQFQRFNQTIT